MMTVVINGTKYIYHPSVFGEKVLAYVYKGKAGMWAGMGDWVSSGEFVVKGFENRASFVAGCEVIEQQR